MPTSSTRRLASASGSPTGEADALTNRQCLYAATDAWTCIRLYEEICRLAETGDYELVTVEEPAPKQERKPINTEA